MTILFTSVILALAPAILQGPGAKAFRQPQMAVDGNSVFLTFGAPNTIYFARSRDRGHSFDDPVRIATVTKMDLGRHRGPRIAVAGNKIVVSAVVTDEAQGVKGDLLAWISGDEGRSWSAPVRVNDVPRAAEEGLHDLTSDGKNLMFATWLDHRALQAKQPGAGPQLYGATSSDGGKTWNNVLVYKSPSGSICSCCHPNALIAPGGNIEVMFRNALQGDRDEYLIESHDRGVTFKWARKLGNGTWPLDACPMDGGGLASGANGQIVSVWRREKTIYRSFATGAEQEVGPGKDADVAVAKDGRYVVWTSPEGLVATGPDSGRPALLDAQGGFGQLRTLKDGRVIAGWESPEGVKIQVLDRHTLAQTSRPDGTESTSVAAARP
jgi:hypothetical protein